MNNSLKRWIIVVGLIAFISYQSQGQPSKTETITITNFKVYEKDAKQVVEWNAAIAADSSWWQVQGSADGQSFTTLAIVLGDDPRQQGTYRYTGKVRKGRSPLKYYRLCYIDNGGTTQMSKIIQPAK